MGSLTQTQQVHGRLAALLWAGFVLRLQERNSERERDGGQLLEQQTPFPFEILSFSSRTLSEQKAGGPNKSINTLIIKLLINSENKAVLMSR